MSYSVTNTTVWSHHSGGSVWSEHTTAIVPPSISGPVRLTNTIFPPAGTTTGSVVRLVNAPPSIETLKSPVARVGDAFILPADAKSTSDSGTVRGTARCGGFTCPGSRYFVSNLKHMFLTL